MKTKLWGSPYIPSAAVSTCKNGFMQEHFFFLISFGALKMKTHFSRSLWLKKRKKKKRNAESIGTHKSSSSLCHLSRLFWWSWLHHSILQQASSSSLAQSQATLWSRWLRLCALVMWHRDWGPPFPTWHPLTNSLLQSAPSNALHVFSVQIYQAHLMPPSY